MAKKSKQTKKVKKIEKVEKIESKNNDKQLPKEVEEKLGKIKKQLEKFKDNIVEKFDKYIVGVGLLPPPGEDQEIPEEHKDKIHTLVLIDDSDSKKMSKEELKEKLGAIIIGMAKEIDPKILPQVVILSELWQNCYDGKNELLQIIAMSAPIYDTGMLSAIKIAEIHKTMVLKKFEKYITTYVLAGSLVQGRATAESDIDVWIVIDDTDVKKMTRAELKDKLRAIIIGMGIEAGEITGIKNKLNIQVYILTDFWDSLKEANPIIFTLLRDGVPFYDKGIFMPWKQLLRMGKIKPSAEAIDLFMSSGEQMLERVNAKIRDIGMEDTFYAILTPSQAALMMYGIPPPTPKETPELMREIFVKKEKLMEEKYVNILEKNIKVRKELEHGSKKEISGKEVDELVTNAKDYLQRIKKLFEQIELIKEEETMLHTYETIVTIVRDIMKLEHVEKVSDKEIVKTFEEKLIHRGKIPERYLRIFKDVMKAKKDYDDKKLTQNEVEKVQKDSRELVKFLVEYMQRKRGRELDRSKIRVKHGSQFGEVILLGETAFIFYDIEKKENVGKAPLDDKGGIGTSITSSLEEFEEHLAKLEVPPKVFIKEKTFEDLKKIFGADCEIQLNY